MAGQFANIPLLVVQTPALPEPLFHRFKAQPSRAVLPLWTMHCINAIWWWWNCYTSNPYGFSAQPVEPCKGYKAETNLTIPIGSMYGIYGNIYHQYTPNVSIYTSTMDPMGYGNAIGAKHADWKIPGEDLQLVHCHPASQPLSNHAMPQLVRCWRHLPLQNCCVLKKKQVNHSIRMCISHVCAWRNIRHIMIWYVIYILLHIFTHYPMINIFIIVTMHVLYICTSKIRPIGSTKWPGMGKIIGYNMER